MGILVLMRHGQSEGNAADLFTGRQDAPLSARGREEARAAGARLATRGLRFEAAFTSALQRAAASCAEVLAALGQPDLPVVADPALNERDYGLMTGLSKDAARRRWGERNVEDWRRSYDRAPPGGESIRDTGARVWPSYLKYILPRVLGGETTLVVGHGNSLRALVMVLEDVAPEDIPFLEIATGVPLVYTLGGDARVTSRLVLAP